MIAAFYDQLAPYHQYLHADWEASVILKHLLKTAGFLQVTILRDRFFQPIIVAHK